MTRPRLRRLLTPVLLLLATLGDRLAAAPPPGGAPALERTVSGELSIGLPTSVLRDPEVARQLRSGLTTGFLLSVHVRDGARRRAEGVARVEVRYELWDEVYLARAFAPTLGAAEPFPSVDQLATWWEGLRLPILTDRDLDERSDWDVELRLDVLPFSAAEQSDAQRWFSDAIASRRSTANDVAEAEGESGERLGALLDLVMATSIQRRAVVSFEWSASLPATARHRPS